MLSRREVLRGTAAPIAIAAMGAGAAYVVAATDDPLIGLERRWQAATAEIKAIGDAFDEQYDNLPEWAKGTWPDVRDLPEFQRGPIRPRSLTELRAFDADFLKAFSILNPDAEDADLELIRARNRARARAWIARRREQKALRRQIGADTIDERLEPYYVRRGDIECEIRETPADSYAGLAVKLRLLANYKALINRPEDWGLDWSDRLALAALKDAERLAKEAQS